MNNKRIFLISATTFSLFFLGIVVHADEAADKLRDQYKDALKQKDIEHATSYICEAAKLDPKKYGKKCDSMQKDLAKQLSQYEALFGTGKFELEHKDYPGAIRDLGKISFGPYRDEAQKLIHDANSLLNHTPQPVNPSMQSLQAAQDAYNNGDFAAAIEDLNAVKNPDLQPTAKQLLANIRIYNQTVAQADLYMQQGNYADAQQQYKIALQLKSNGPGNLADKLQQIAKLLEKSSNTTVTATTGSAAQVTATGKIKPTVQQSSPRNSIKIKSDLADAHNHEEKGELDAALASYERVLELDPTQTDALAGEQRVSDKLRKDPTALEDALIAGIRSYYQSHLSEARTAISLYLTEGGQRSKGAAHFYLGATLMTEALLLNPENRATFDSLQRDAKQEFLLAKQEHFKPAQKYVSPKILAIWNQTGS
jgi:tetratricopeptide (TPR) repeat protein